MRWWRKSSSGESLYVSYDVPGRQLQISPVLDGFIFDRLDSNKARNEDAYILLKPPNNDRIFLALW